MRTLYQILNCLPGPHGRQRHLKVGRGLQKYDFFYDGGIHFRSRTRIGTMHMFIGQFFKENSNFDILEVVCFETLHVTHVYMPDFQGEYEFHTYRSVEDHLQGPGLLREQHTHGLRPGIAYILKT